MSSFVHTGFYIDYGSSPSHKRLLSNRAANIIMVITGILVSTALNRLWRIFSRVYNLTKSWTWLDQAPSVYPLDAEEKPELAGAIASEGFHRILRARERNNRFPGALRLPEEGLPPPKGLSRASVRWDYAVGFGLMAVFVGFNICGVLTSCLRTDSRALSRHPDCGIWVPDTTNDPEAALRLARPVEFSKQTESAALAERCYVPSSGASSEVDGCSYFVRSSIQVDTREIECPFGDLCHEDSRALEVSTPAISARVLGINAPRVLEFRRRSVCSPLKMNDQYVRRANHGKEHTYTYFYGSSHDRDLGDATWLSSMYGNGLTDKSAYDLNAIRSGPNWSPLKSLRPPRGATTTLIFVTAGGIFYERPEMDPIFPAKTPVQIANHSTFYLNTRGHAGVLACTDIAELRDPRSSKQWTNMFEAGPPEDWDSQSRGGVVLLWRSLLYSSIYQTVSGRSGEALEAQKRISHKVSLSLDGDQWRTEVFSLFKVSLARIQIEVRDIARGTGAGMPGFVKLDPGVPNADMCQNTYIFFSKGYVNVNDKGLWSVLGIGLFIVICAIPGGDKALWPEVAWAKLRGNEPLIRLCQVIAAPFEEDGAVRSWALQMLEWLRDQKDWIAEWKVWEKTKHLRRFGHRV